jgi:hypothetical protein
MNKLFRALRQRGRADASRQRLWVKRVLLYIAAIFVLGCSGKIASAQLMSPGYVFVEVSDEAARPVSGAAVVLYNLDGSEIGSNVTEKSGLASMRKQSYRPGGKLILRVIKSGYATKEVTLDTDAAYWKDENLKIKLLAVSKPARKDVPAPRKSKPARASKRAPPVSGLSPPGASLHNYASLV